MLYKIFTKFIFPPQGEETIKYAVGYFANLVIVNIILISNISKLEIKFVTDLFNLKLYAIFSIGNNPLLLFFLNYFYLLKKFPKTTLKVMEILGVFLFNACIRQKT